MRRAVANGMSASLEIFTGWPDVLACTTQVDTSERVARERFDFELADPSHLDAVLAAVRKVDAVFDVYRILPGQKGVRQQA